MADEKHAQHAHAHEQGEKKKEEVSIYLVAAFAGLFLVLLLFNQVQMADVYSALANGGSVAASTVATASTATPSSGTGGVALTGDVTQDAINIIIPTGTPAGYGTELGVSFDDPVKGYRIMGNIDRSVNYNSMSPEEQKRYMAIGTRAACEYCCGAKTLITQSGQPACGCEHSYAMRGLAKYLIQKHGSEYSDYQIITEINKWKAIYFPKQTVKNAIAYFEKNGKFDQEEIWNSMSR